jgi:NADH-ubiquinone oxidoreductase chain 6
MNFLIINIIFPFLILLASVLSITAKNPVISVTYLIITFVLAAGEIMAIGINFIGISYIIVYVGAIAVLFLFIIMMLDIKLSDILDYDNQYNKSLPLGLMIVSLIIAYFYITMPQLFENFNQIIEKLLFNFNSIIFNIQNNNQDLIIYGDWNSPSVVSTLNIDSNLINNSQVFNIGFDMYVNNPIFLIIVSIILLFAMISAIIICYFKNK